MDKPQASSNFKTKPPALRYTGQLPLSQANLNIVGEPTPETVQQNFSTKGAMSPTNPSALASTLIGGCVDTATGRFVERTVDLFEPVSGLGIVRQYVSELQDVPPMKITNVTEEGFTFFRGWDWNLNSMMFFRPHWKVMKTADARTGVRVTFDTSKSEIKVHSSYFSGEKYLLSNEGAHGDWRNKRIEVNIEKANLGDNWLLREENGVKRLFSGLGEAWLQPDRSAKNGYLIRNESQRVFPNGIQWLFKHKTPFKLEEVTAMDTTGKNPIYSIHREGFCFESDTGAVQYFTNGCAPHARTCAAWCDPVSQTPDHKEQYLTQVISTTAPNVTYEYTRLSRGRITYDYLRKPGVKKTFTAPLLSCKRYPDGRYLRIQYYDTFRKVWIHRGHSKESVEKPNAGMVQGLYAPAGFQGKEVCLYHFEYDGPVVTITDAVGRKTTHTFDHKRRLIEEKVQLEDQPAEGVHYYIWGEGENAGRLVAHYTKDSRNKVLSHESFTYDEWGNVLSSTEHGDFSGKSLEIILNNEQMPMSGESRTILFTYDPETHLVVEEKRSEGTRIIWRYHVGTHQVSAKFVEQGEGENCCLSRVFYTYDSFGNISMQVEDNGQGEEFEDLSDVSVRTIIRRHAFKESPHAGLIEEEQESYYNIDLDAEIPLVRRTFGYNGKRQCILQSTYVDGIGEVKEHSFIRDDHGNVIYEKEGAALAVNRSYDACDNLISEVCGGTQRLFTYDTMNRCVQEQILCEEDGSQYTHKYIFDPMGQLIEKQYPHGAKEVFAYNALGRCIEKKWQYLTADGKIASARERYHFDLFGQMTTKSLEDGCSDFYRYTRRGQLCYCSTGGKKWEHYTYNTLGCLLEKTTSGGVKELFTYDQLGRCIHKSCMDTDQGGVFFEENYTYTKRDLTEIRDSCGKVSRRSYDGRGRVTRVQTYTAETGPDEVLTDCYYSYDGFDHCIRKQEQCAQTQLDTCAEFDHRGNCVFYSIKDGKGKALHLEERVYGPNNHLQHRQGTVLGKHFEEENTYNALGFPESFSNTNGQRRDYSYSYLVDKKKGFLCEDVTITKEDGTYIVETYCGAKLLHRAVHLSNGSLISREQFEYDSHGRCIARGETPYACDKAQQIRISTRTCTNYNDQGHLRERLEAVGTKCQKQFSWKYDSEGRMSAFVKPSGKALYYFYDGSGRLISRKSSDGSVNETLTYDASGTQIGGRCESNSAEYSWLLTLLKQGEVNEAVIPEIELWSKPVQVLRTLNASMQIIKEQQASGVTLSYTRDGLNRVQTMHMPGVAVTRSYEHLTPTRVDFSLKPSPNAKTQCGYYLYSNLDAFARPCSETLFWGCEKQDREEIQFSKALSSARSYDATGQLLSKEYLGVFSESIQARDTQKRPTKIALKHLDDRSLRSFSYDPLGQVVRVEEQVEGGKKLVSVFNYDSQGYRLKARNKQYYRGDNGDLQRVTSHLDSDKFVYDSDGCIVARKKDDKVYIMQYDLLDRLIAVAQFQTVNASSTEMFSIPLQEIDPSGLQLSQLVCYRYDIFGRRSATLRWNAIDSACKLAYLVYDGFQEVGSVEYCPQHAVSSKEGMLPNDLVWKELRILGSEKGSESDQTLVVHDSTGTYAVCNDIEGSIVARIDPVTGYCLRSQFYDLFGEEREQGIGDVSHESRLKMCAEDEGNHVFLSAWGYKGKRKDPLSGFIFFGQREYIPEHGQWLTRDPAGERDGSNLVNYLKNAPLQSGDEWGLFKEDFTQASSYALTDDDLLLEQSQEAHSFYSEYMEDLFRELDPKVLKNAGCSFHLMLNTQNATSKAALRLEDRPVVVYVNGINTDKSEVMAFADDISRSKGVHVLCVYNPTRGLLRDALGVLKRVLRWKSKKDPVLAQMCLKAVEKAVRSNCGKRTLCFAHSEGEVHMRAVRSSLHCDALRDLWLYNVGGIDPGIRALPNNARIQAKGDFLSQPLGIKSFRHPFSVQKRHSNSWDSFYKKCIEEIIDSPEPH